MPRGIHPGAEVPGVPGLNGQQQGQNVQFAANPMAQMMGAAPGMPPFGAPQMQNMAQMPPGMVPMQGAAPGAMPQVLIQPGPNGMATIVPLGSAGNAQLEEEDDEEEEE